MWLVGGSLLTLASHPGGGGRGHVKIVRIKSLKNFLARFAHSVFINQPIIFS